MDWSKELENARGIAEGVIACSCGNKDWKMFLYIGDLGGFSVAACKKCGRIYNHKDGEWKLGGPDVDMIGGGV